MVPTFSARHQPWVGHLLIVCGFTVVPPFLGSTSSASQRNQKPSSQPNPQAVKFFESKVRPVLANRCYKCHGKRRQRGGLRVDSLAAILEGGDTGPAIKPGNPDESLLVRAIGHRGELKMPPRSKLPGAEVDNLTAWVKMGAPWPNATIPKAPKKRGQSTPFTKEQSEFWSFQRPVSPPLPQVTNQHWVKSPIDTFILAKLEANGLKAAPPVDRATLIRRATFDLIGLPPTPEEVEAFVNDPSPQAFARVVDRLLASPHYGERWGRHWLDVVRYADSNGMDENLGYVNAFRYRDYVVRAFNNDKPYDRFVQEQLAGDLLPDGGPDGMIATGFLCVGPKMLAEDDPVKMEMDIIDEQLDTIGRTFMGLTIGCARCHDHKFDPITAADYYGLAGIFKSTKTMDNFRVVARWHERPVATKAVQLLVKQHKRNVDLLTKNIERTVVIANNRLLQVAREKVAAYLKAATELQKFNQVESKLRPLVSAPDPKRGTIVLEAEKFDRGNVLKAYAGYGAKIGVIYNKGTLPNVAEYDVVTKAGVFQLDIRYAAADSRPVKLSINGKLVKQNAAGNVTGSWYPDSQKWAVEGLYFLKAGKNVIRLECAGPFPHFDKLALARYELPEIPKSAEQIAKEYGLHSVFLRQWAAYLEKAKRVPSGDSLRKIIDNPKGPFALPAKTEEYYPPTILRELKRLRSELARLQKTAPKVPLTMAVAEREVVNTPVHIRGNHLTLGQVIPRRYPQIFASTRHRPL
ncbi:MAG: DUF1549 domain-containing protein [Gemmataceae bacterium]